MSRVCGQTTPDTEPSVPPWRTVYQGWTEPSQRRNVPESSRVRPSTIATMPAAPSSTGMSARRAAHVGLEEAGMDADDGDAGIAQVHRLPHADHVERRLRRRVADVATERVRDLHRARLRRHVHDSRPRRCTQAIDHCPGQQHRSGRVHAHDLEEGVAADLQHVSCAVVDTERAGVDARVVVEDVDRRGAERLGERRDRSLGSHVDRQHVRRERVQLARLVGSPAPRPHLIAPCGVLSRELETEAPVRTGDDDAFGHELSSPSVSSATIAAPGTRPCTAPTPVPA